MKIKPSFKIETEKATGIILAQISTYQPSITIANTVNRLLKKINKSTLPIEEYSLAQKNLQILSEACINSSLIPSAKEINNVSDILYFHHSTLTSEDLAQAESFVKEHLDNLEACWNFLIENRTWLQSL